MEDVRAFLNISSGDGSGTGTGSGDGSGTGTGSGDGSGSGSGDGYGYGSGTGTGSGDGSGYGSGYCSGSGDGYGSGSGSGYGSGISDYNGAAVYIIDGVQTLIARVRGNVACGFVLSGDLTLQPCFIVKQDDKFAHGETLHAARAALLDKLFADMPLEERISAFVEAHKSGKAYPNKDFFDWHHKLTGSCDMGRRQFAADHGISLDDNMTPEAFIKLTENAYGGDVIRRLKEYYPQEEK